MNVRIVLRSNGIYQVEYRDPKTGKRVRRKFKSKAEAEGIRDELIANYNIGKLPRSSSRLVAVLMQLHIDEFPNTKVRLVGSRFLHFMDHLGNFDINQIGKLEMQIWLSKLQNDYQLHEKTLNRTKSQFNHFFNWAIERGYIRESPFRYLKFKEKGYVTPPVVLTVDETRDILEKAKHFEDGTLYNFLFITAMTACRRGELLKLRWSDIDFGLDTITFRVTKNRNLKVLPMSDNLRDHLKSMDRCGEYVFMSKDGNHYSGNTLSHVIRRFKAKHNFEKNWNTKSFRHGFCRMAKMSGWDPHAIQKFMGHETLQMTMGTYGQTMATDYSYSHPLKDLK